MDCVAYPWGQYGCSSPSTKVLHGLDNINVMDDMSILANCTEGETL